ncbi:MAG: hypothetical protein HY560_01610 [Gemmatimonadetes bacterium]|nr:hypothetical protein [Gemmatimonadota bacterium]
MEQLRRERERAREILRGPGATPVIAPPFGAIKNRGQRASEDRRKIARLRNLAWAASVVLAVFVGWYAGQASFRTAPTASTSVPAPAPAAGGGPTAPRRTEEQAVSADKPAPAPAPLAQLALRDTVVAAAPRMDPPVSAEPKPAAAPEAALAPQPAGVEAARLRAVPAAAGVGAGAEWGSWKPITAAAAAEILGRAPILVPELPVSSYEASTSGERAVRIVQSLGAGSILELIEMPTPAPARAVAQRRAAAAEAPATGRETDRPVTVTVGDVTVTARATVPGDSLRVLVAKLR